MASARGSLSARPINIKKVTVAHLERLYSRTVTVGDCVIHTSPHHTGYSYTRVDSVRHPAHRLVKAVSLGKDFPGLVTDHTCGNKSCININHLEIVTQSENIKRGTSWLHFKNKIRQTHCKRGHEYDYRTMVNGYSSGICSACRKINYRAKLASMEADKLSEIASKGGKKSKRGTNNN